MHLTPLGDRALLITLGDSIDETTHRLVRAVCARLIARALPGFVELIPAYASVAVHYDPAAVPNGNGETVPYERFSAAVAAALADLGDEELPPPRRVEIPVCYGGQYGPDLDDLAREHGLTADDVVRLHSGATYRVYMLGFAPGFAYLGGLSKELATPRRTEPRTNVPAGSVGIGGKQTGVYSLPSPGGWHLIGRTPIKMFDATRDSPALLATGDMVTFRPIQPNEFGG
jgi:inhibitor of KinA